jgi:hypothetical protein
MPGKTVRAVFHERKSHGDLRRWGNRLFYGAQPRSQEERIEPANLWEKDKMVITARSPTTQVRQT